MQVLRTHVAGVDVHKEILAITALIGGPDEEAKETQFKCNTFTEDLIMAGRKLLDLGVRHVAMESTGVYWRPIYNVWAPMGIHITVGQAAHIKNVPGRKTDLNDSQWIAKLHRFGLIRPSMIPEDTFQRIRLISRHRTNLVNDLARVKNRVQKTLEDGNIKWGSIVSDVFGKSGLQVLRLLADNVMDATTLSSAVTTKIKRKEEVRKSLTNCFTLEHCFLIKELMEQFDSISKQISSADEKLRDLCEPYRHLIEKLTEIPGINEVLAQGILGEATDNMEHFKDERFLLLGPELPQGATSLLVKKKNENKKRESSLKKNVDSSSKWCGKEEKEFLSK